MDNRSCLIWKGIDWYWFSGCCCCWPDEARTVSVLEPCTAKQIITGNENKRRQTRNTTADDLFDSGDLRLSILAESLSILFRQSRNFKFLYSFVKGLPMWHPLIRGCNWVCRPIESLNRANTSSWRRQTAYPWMGVWIKCCLWASMSALYGEECDEWLIDCSDYVFTWYLLL